MKVILLEAVEGLGERGNQVQVKPGYARNYLFPRRLAVRATPAGEAIFREEVRGRERRESQAREAAQEVLAKLENVEVHLRAQAAEDGKLYGSVSAAEIAGELAGLGYTLERKAILLEEPIKQIGVYAVDVKLGPDVTGAVKVWVEREGEE